MNWIKWPEGYYDKNYLPWYTILRRLIFTVPVFIGFCIVYVFGVLGYGFKGAERFRKDFW